MDNIEIGKRIKQSREEKDMSLQDVANLTGVARSTVQRYEAGRIDKIKLPVIESIARALEVRPDWIIGKTDKKFPETEFVPEILLYYKSLNTTGKNIATEQVRLLTLDEKYTRNDSIILFNSDSENRTVNAAHRRTDIPESEITPEMIQADEDIMKNF